MKTSLLLAFIASTALSASALAQSTGTDTGSGSTSGTGTSTTTPATGSGGTSGSTSTGSGASAGGGTSSGSTTTDTGSGSATPGSQSPNPNAYGSASGAARNSGGNWNGGGWAGGSGGGWNGQPLMQGMMTCVSPAPMGGFGSFACYPAGWGMGMDMMDWHSQMRRHHRDRGYWKGSGEDGSDTPNQYYEERQSRDRNRNRVPGFDSNGSSSDGYDNDWRSNSGSNDGNYGSDDYNSN